MQATGHMVKISMFEHLGLNECLGRLQELLRKVREIKMDHNEYICLKFLILLNPGELRSIVKRCRLSISAPTVIQTNIRLNFGIFE